MPKSISGQVGSTEYIVKSHCVKRSWNTVVLLDECLWPDDRDFQVGGLYLVAIKHIDAKLCVHRVS